MVSPHTVFVEFNNSDGNGYPKPHFRKRFISDSYIYRQYDVELCNYQTMVQHTLCILEESSVCGCLIWVRPRLYKF